ncbi:MAG: family 20 glycosylhydrolase [Pyrinomonadaceae bacterium]
MRSIASILLAVFSFVAFSSAQFNEINIIPQPADYERREGTFVLSRKTKIVVTRPGFVQSAEVLREEIFRRYGFKLKITNKPQRRNFILFDLVGQGYAALREKGEYHLVVEDQAVRVMAGSEGQFYGIQTLLQIMPPESEGTIKIHAATIYDGPRFAYRGMHLDVSRHFQPVEFVKKYIDRMAQFKFNTFHWHLTDDQGWRIEIKKYPKLTTVGQYRSESHMGPYSPIFKGDGRPVEGFYTQEQIKDVVAYAKARHITVIPEIELPGHASAALAAYPELGKGCAAPDYKFEVKKTWGIFKEVFCPTEETFKFLENVLDETIKLFPDSPYIHIGGDEVLKDFWKESPFVQELMKRENLKDEHEVQSYFIRRIEKFINLKGKKIIGWDEILEGGVAPNATIMSWRGEKGGIEAAKAHHDVIMTPNTYVYFDYGQGDPAYEPLNIGGYLPLERVYDFDPVPSELSAEEAKYILGGQANLWTEYIETPDRVEYMIFPRMLALSEVLWSKKEDRNWTDFQRRLNAILPRLDKQGINYRIPEPGGLKNMVTRSERVSIELRPAPGTRVHYTIDCSTPDENSPVYEKPVEIVLKEDEVKTLKTVVVLPTGRKSVVYAATIVRGTMREAESTTASEPGVIYNLVVPNDSGGDPAERKGETRSIMLTQFAKTVDLKKRFGVQFDGYFKAAIDGVYEFQVDSTWDTTVVLGGKMIIDDVGTAASKKRSVILPLKAGLHKISLRYNHRGGEANFRFRYGIKGQGLRQAYGGEFVH